MWPRVRRYGLLAYLNLSEALLRSFGRRQPYGILRIDLGGELGEESGGTRLLGGLLARPRLDHFGLLASLRWARDDPQLRAVFMRCSDLRAGWAKVQEIRRSLGALRTAGKQVWVHLAHAGIQEYVLASAADRIFLAPAGTLDIAGLSTEVTFYAEALHRLGIEAELVQLGRYKSAGESFTRNDMSAAHREMVESVLHDLYEQVTEAIAQGRGLDEAAVRACIDRGPFVAPEAQRERLVDDLLYEDETEDRLRAQCGDVATISLSDYRQRRSRWVRRTVLGRDGKSIAVLHVTGPIKTGDSIPGPEAASACGVATLTRSLREIREARDVAALVLRISSPGGSGLASDLLWHEVARTRESKPVVVSFGDVAASGGYYVGVAGSPVVAEGGTITGSIGVLAGKPLLRGLYNRFGITKQIVSRGRHSALHSDYVPLGDEERQRLQDEAQHFYTDFVEKVARGRQLTLEAVQAVAEGRVWTGRQALAHGLIDQLGGLEAALDRAKQAIGLAPGDLAYVRRYPRPKRLWKLSFNVNPVQSRLTPLFPWLRFLTSERIWALLPFHLRFS